jgi:hypothetical protein
MTEIERLYDERAATPSDISEHMPLLRRIASQSLTVAEFGVRSGNSTVALLCGLSDAWKASQLCRRLYSYDRNPAGLSVPDSDRYKWEFAQADTGNLEAIPPVDLLFIDTLHTAKQVRAELVHAGSVRRWIAFHDTVLFGSRDEEPGTGPGICHAIFEWLATREGWSWGVDSHMPNNNGLLLLRRRVR